MNRQSLQQISQASRLEAMIKSANIKGAASVVD